MRFDDVAGLQSAKQDLREIVEFLREPERFRRLGGKVPRGVLLVGPPGTGKTLVARAVAGESGVPFFSINGSEFIELFVGVGGGARPRAVRRGQKDRAQPSSSSMRSTPSAVSRNGARRRKRRARANVEPAPLRDGRLHAQRHDHRARGDQPARRLDPALLRPGRFDRRVVIDRPASTARLSILEVHARGKPLGTDVNSADLASNTPGFSGADLANLVNEAALSATRRGANAHRSRRFQRGVRQGRARRSCVKLGSLRMRSAASRPTSRGTPSWRISRSMPSRFVGSPFCPRGMALGLTQQSLTEDRHLATQPEIEAKLAVLLGGYAAETLIYGSQSSGSENDLQGGDRARLQDGGPLSG